MLDLIGAAPTRHEQCGSAGDSDLPTKALNRTNRIWQLRERFAANVNSGIDVAIEALRICMTSACLISHSFKKTAFSSSIWNFAPFCTP
ncbi:hypothetical protein [Caballeronia mineralivorans]|uniref:hypothetical protein n=1 Tax=Caballeronia mineralivorans TaxID=2010198 RepID=UPI00128DC35C|nr:hypothetical protein [Caballeronia mineralivorans]